MGDPTSPPELEKLLVEHRLVQQELELERSRRAEAEEERSKLKVKLILMK